VRILIGLGANLGNPPETFQTALALLDESCRIVAASSLYRTRPEGPPQQEFFNMAALLEVEDDPAALLAECQRIEAVVGRDWSRQQRWGPRVLDLDLLIALGVLHRGPALVLPHPLFARRAFALVPAAELAPSWIHPVVGRSIGELALGAERRDPNAILERLEFASDWKH
jgi:2-amino-4-hydroxy-6-hydroxymethyldihydropteridine diphosphokinase